MLPPLISAGYFKDAPKDVILTIAQKLQNPRDVAAFGRTCKRIRAIADSELYTYKLSMVRLLRDMLLEVSYHAMYADKESISVIEKLRAALISKKKFEETFNVTPPTGIIGVLTKTFMDYMEAPLLDRTHSCIKKFCQSRDPEINSSLWLITTTDPYNKYLEFSRHKLTSLHRDQVRHFCGNTTIDREALKKVLESKPTSLTILRGLFDNIELYPDLLEFAEKSPFTNWIQICGNVTSNLPLVTNLVSVLEKFESLRFLMLSNFSIGDADIETLKHLFELSFTKTTFTNIIIRKCDITEEVEKYIKKVNAENTFPQLKIVDQTKDKF